VQLSSVAVIILRESTPIVMIIRSREACASHHSADGLRHEHSLIGELLTAKEAMNADFAHMATNDDGAN
jgi:hypothetical protein